MEKAAVPVTLTVTGTAELVVPSGCEGKEILIGEKLATLPSTVPVNAIACGLSLALSVIVRVAVSVPEATVGAKVTAMLQFAPTLTILPQVLD
jgi:hypothetical protein